MVSNITAAQIATLASLANGIIPADETGAGAASVNAAHLLAERIDAGVNAKLYLSGLELADRLARETYGVAVTALSPTELHELIGGVRDALPGFFKQLRLDVSAIYLGDPATWRRIGFPGPSSDTGGHPDFDLPQK